MRPGRMTMQKPNEVPTVSPTAHVATNATVIGDGPIKTVFGPHGEAHAIIENGSSGTVL